MLLAPEHKKRGFSVERGDHARGLLAQDAKVRDRPADGISIITACGSTVNDAADDFVEAIPGKQQVAHTHPLLSLCPDSAEERMCSESEYSGKALINMHLVNGLASVTESVPA